MNRRRVERVARKMRRKRHADQWSNVFPADRAYLEAVCALPLSAMEIAAAERIVAMTPPWYKRIHFSFGRRQTMVPAE
jgi:hypothetical protein